LLAGIVGRRPIIQKKQPKGGDYMLKALLVAVIVLCSANAYAWSVYDVDNSNLIVGGDSSAVDTNGNMYLLND
jgi:hypothetical protein